VELANASKDISLKAEEEFNASDPAEKKRLHDQRQKMKKQRLPLDVFQGTFDDDHRLQSCIHLNGLYMTDLDSKPGEPPIDPEAKYREWMELWPELDPKKPRLQRMAEDLGLVYIATTSSGRGIRMVGKAKLEVGDLWQNQLWLAEQLKMEVVVDGQCKDANRASYKVPFANIEYLSDELFTYHNIEYAAKYDPVYRAKGKGAKKSTAPQPAATAQPATAPQTAPVVTTPAPADKSQADTYLGVPYPEYIDTYWQLFNNGQTPTEGARDTLTFELACNLRHICGFDRQLMDRVIPCYDGFPEAEKLAKIDSALAQERKGMPYRMRKTLEAVSKAHSGNTELLCGIQETTEQTLAQVYQELRPAIPFGVRESLSNLGMVKMPALTSLFPTLGGLATRVRLDIHGEGFTNLNLQSYCEGKAASNKSKLSKLYKLWTREQREADRLAEQQEQQHQVIQRKKTNARERPEEKHFKRRLQSARTSMSEILYRLQHAEGEHLITFCAESDQLAQGKQQVWSDMSVLLRCAYDGEEFSQDFKSDAATRAWIEHVLWNISLCGTLDALYRMFTNYTDGSITRLIIDRTPDNTFKPLTPQRPLSEKEILCVNRCSHLLTLMQGDLVLPRLEKVCQQWLEKVRLETIKDDDAIRAGLRMRVAISVMRCIACLMLCDFAGWLIRQIEEKKERPEWAGECTTADDYLIQHPEATAYWLPKRFQKKAMLSAFNTLADYYLDNLVYLFGDRIAQAYQHQTVIIRRASRGRNDSIYNRLPNQFDIPTAQRERGDDPTSGKTRSMLKNWVRQGLIRSIAHGKYEKVS